MVHCRPAVIVRRLAALVALAVLLPGRVAAHAPLDILEDTSAEAVRQHPDDPDVHFRRALVHQLAEEWEAALAAVAHAEGRGADPDAVAAARGRILLAAGRPALAKREFARVLTHQPARWAVVFERGRTALALGRPGAAARDFGRALRGLAEPTPDHVLAWRDALLAAGRRAEAVRALDEGMDRVGQVPSLELAALDLEIGLDRLEAALLRIDRMLARNPDNPAWIARRGELLARAGRVAEAHAAFRQALVLIETRPRHRRGQRLDALARAMRVALGRTEGTP
jgi:tetratricopeptide (TPR) repeat protein